MNPSSTTSTTFDLEPTYKAVVAELGYDPVEDHLELPTNDQLLAESTYPELRPDLPTDQPNDRAGEESYDASGTSS